MESSYHVSMYEKGYFCTLICKMVLHVLVANNMLVSKNMDTLVYTKVFLLL